MIWKIFSFVWKKSLCVGKNVLFWWCFCFCCCNSQKTPEDTLFEGFKTHLECNFLSEFRNLQKNDLNFSKLTFFVVLLSVGHAFLELVNTTSYESAKNSLQSYFVSHGLPTWFWTFSCKNPQLNIRRCWELSTQCQSAKSWLNILVFLRLFYWFRKNMAASTESTTENQLIDQQEKFGIFFSDLGSYNNFRNLLNLTNIFTI